MAAFTSRWGLRKSTVSETASVALDLHAPYDIIDGALGSTVCTSSTRPGSPVQGQIIYETDTRRTYLWSGAVWLPIGPLTAVKTSDLTKNANTTLTDDTQLVLPVLASTTYQVEACLIYAASTAADAKFGLTVPAGATFQMTSRALITTVAATSGVIERAVATANPFVMGGNGVGVKLVAAPVGTLVVAGTAGNVAVSFAQSTSDATNTLLYTGSWLRLTRI